MISPRQGRRNGPPSRRRPPGLLPAPCARTRPRRAALRARLAASGLAALGALTLGATAAGAAKLVLRLDPEATRITWTLGATLHTVEGSFSLKEGVIRFDPATGEASGRIVIPAASGTSGNEKRDRKMHRKVLESEKHPEIVFRPRRLGGSFEPGRGGEVALEGLLEIHGTRREITLAGEVQISEGRLTGTAEMAIPYVEWGMEDPSVFLLRVDKHVNVRLELAGSIAPAETPQPEG